MNNYGLEMRRFLDGIARRHSAQNITAKDLRRLPQIDKSIPRTENDLRRRLNDILELMDSGGNIQSRPDSHHWDQGLCEIESAARVIYAAEGHVLCAECGDNNEDSLALYSPEEVREIGGAWYF